MQKSVVIPFAGFYDSHHDSELDTALERICEISDSGDVCETLLDYARDAAEWGYIHEAYAKLYTEIFANTFKIEGLTFEHIKSPREYNFETDRIFCNIPMATVRAMIKGTKREYLAQCATDNFSSRSGFISFYSPDFTSWGPVPQWDCNKLMTLVQAYVLTLRDGEAFDSYAEYEMMADSFGNGALDNVLFSGDAKQLNRIDRIARYLRTRNAR